MKEFCLGISPLESEEVNKWKDEGSSSLMLAQCHSRLRAEFSCWGFFLLLYWGGMWAQCAAAAALLGGEAIYRNSYRMEGTKLGNL